MSFKTFAVHKSMFSFLCSNSLKACESLVFHRNHQIELVLEQLMLLIESFIKEVLMVWFTTLTGRNTCTFSHLLLNVSTGTN